MRVIFDYQIFLKQEYGGPSRYFVELNKNLNNININSAIFAPIHANDFVSKKSFSIKLKKRKNFFINSILAKTNEYLTHYYLKDKKNLLIHPTYYNFDYLFSNKNKKVITVFDLIHEKFYSSERIKKYKDEKIRALKESDFIICISENTKKDLIEYYNVSDKKIKVIYLAGLIKQDKEFKIENSSDKPYVLYVGNRHGYKNFEIILQAIKSNNEFKDNFQLFFFGGGSFSKNEIQMFKKYKFEIGEFKHIGSNEQILGSLYSKAFCLIYPSLYEGFGLPVLEAMENNCPVICSNNSSLPEVGGDAVEYFDPKKKESLIQALKNITLSNTNRENMIKKGFLRSKMFSWKNTAFQTNEVYQSLL